MANKSGDKLVEAPVVRTPGISEQFPYGTHVLISGDCRSNARVVLYRDEGTLGEAVVVGTRWFYYWRSGIPYSNDNLWLGWVGHGAGLERFYAKQFNEGQPSLPSRRQQFVSGQMEKSPVPVMTFPKNGHEFLVNSNDVVFLGTSNRNTSVSVISDGMESDGVGQAGNWYSTSWSSYAHSATVQAKQTIPGYLQSDLTPPITFKYVDPTEQLRTNGGAKKPNVESSNEKKVPAPPNIEFPFNGMPILAEQQILIRGACEEGAEVELTWRSQQAKKAGVVGKAWYCTYSPAPQDFGGSAEIRARQRVSGSEYSQWSDPVKVNTNPLSPPQVIYPVSGGKYPVGDLFMSGICDEDAVVEVLAKDGSFVGNAVVKGTTWVYYREWAIGLYQLKVKQTYLGHTSLPSELHEFSIGDLEAPTVLTPKPIEGFPAGTHVLVSGTCRENAEVEVFNHAGKWGDALVVGTRWFFHRIWGCPESWEGWYGWVGRGADAGFVHAVQVVNGLRSSPSVPRIYSIGRQVKSPIPEVVGPKDEREVVTNPDRGFVLVNCEAGADVEVLVDGHLYFGSEERDGMCVLGHTVHPGRSYTYQFRQTSPGFLPSDFGPPITLKYVAANPEKSTVDSNAFTDKASSNAQKPNAPSITMPVQGDSVLLSKKYCIAGACEEGALVEYESTHVNGAYRVTALVLGTTWYGDFSNGLSPSTYRARQRVNGSEFSDWSESVTMTADLTAPLIVFPASGSNHPEGGLFMSGVCDVNATVEILAQDGAFLGNAEVKDKIWVYYREWTKGLKHVQVKQTFLGHTSRLSEVHEFIIR